MGVGKQPETGDFQPLEQATLGGVSAAAALAHEHNHDPAIAHEYHGGDLP